MVIVDDKDDMLLSYRKFGEGKVGIVDYNFNITEDCFASISVKLSQENRSQEYRTKEVMLDDDEMGLLEGFIDKFIIPKKSEVILYHDEIERYDGEDISSCGIMLQDEEEVNDAFKQLRDYIVSNHDELNDNKITFAYEVMENTVGRSL